MYHAVSSCSHTCSYQCSLHNWREEEVLKVGVSVEKKTTTTRVHVEHSLFLEWFQMQKKIWLTCVQETMRRRSLKELMEIRALNAVSNVESLTKEEEITTTTYPDGRVTVTRKIRAPHDETRSSNLCIFHPNHRCTDFYSCPGQWCAFCTNLRLFADTRCLRSSESVVKHREVCIPPDSCVRECPAPPRYCHTE